MTAAVAQRADTWLRSVRRRIRGAKTRITGGSQLAGQRVSEVAWPRESVLVAIERHESLLVPRGDLRLLPGDHLSIFATPAARPQVDDLVDTPLARADHGVADAPATAVGAPEG